MGGMKERSKCKKKEIQKKKLKNEKGKIRKVANDGVEK